MINAVTGWKEEGGESGGAWSTVTVNIPILADARRVKSVFVVTGTVSKPPAAIIIT